MAFAALAAALRSRRELTSENLALWVQLASFTSRGRQPLVRPADRLLWVLLRRLWNRWSDALVFVSPDTVLRWHHAGFRLYWSWLSRRRRRPGRPPLSQFRALVLLYALFFIRHGRRQIVRFNVAAHPTAAWVVQQIRDAFPFDSVPRHLILDRDSAFSAEVLRAIRAVGSKPVRTSSRSPWQNGTAERWVGSCRRELLDRVLVLNEAHLHRLLTDYVQYYHDDRTHCGLGKTTPAGRSREPWPSSPSKVIALPRLGGLHHRYTWNQAA